MASTFDNFPNEILVDILKHLDVSSIKNAALVCKRWSDVIGYSPTLMHKFVLNIARYSNRDLTVVLNCQRKFVNVCVALSRRGRCNLDRTDDPGYNRLLVQVFEHVGMGITHFSLQRSRLKRHELTSILMSMPKLSAVVFSEVEIVESQNGQKATLLLEKLTVLKASYSTWSLMDIILAPNLTYLSIGGLNGNFHPTSFIKFIETAVVLQTLIIHSPYETPKLCGNAPSYFCKNFLVFYETLGSIDSMFLRRLEFLQIGGFTSSSWDQFCKFLSQRSNTLTKLTINWGCTRDHPKEAFARLFRVVFGDLKRLNELTIGEVLQCCPNDESVFSSLKLNKSIECLNLGIYSCSQNVFERVLGICRSLTSLEILELTEERALFIANNLNLTKLTIKGIRCDNVRFPTLKVLEIRYVQKSSQWQNFLKINGTIQTLLASRIPCDFMDFILDETNVEHLTIKSDDPISSDLYRKIAENPKSLRTLEWICLGRRRNRLFGNLPINRDLNQIGSKKSNNTQCSKQSSGQPCKILVRQCYSWNR